MSNIMPGFEEAWMSVAHPRDAEFVSDALRPLLEVVYRCVLSNPPDLSDLKRGLWELLDYLNNEGRTNANCRAVDLFFGEARGGERDWTDELLPNDFHDVLATMGDALHDTVEAPDVARNFGCLPEQLLELVKRLDI